MEQGRGVQDTGVTATVPPHDLSSGGGTEWRHIALGQSALLFCSGVQSISRQLLKHGVLTSPTISSACSPGSEK